MRFALRRLQNVTSCKGGGGACSTAKETQLYGASLPVAFPVRFLLSLCSFAPFASFLFSFLPLLLHSCSSFPSFPSCSSFLPVLPFLPFLPVLPFLPASLFLLCYPSFLFILSFLPSCSHFLSLAAFFTAFYRFSVCFVVPSMHHN